MTTQENILLEEFPTNEGEAKKGLVYLLINPSFEGICKIGFTASDTVSKRINELNASTSLPLPFELVKAWEVEDYLQVEKCLHNQLEPCRVNPKREFFRIQVGKALDLIDHICEGISKGADYEELEEGDIALVELKPSSMYISSLLQIVKKNLGKSINGITAKEGSHLSRPTICRILRGEGLSSVVGLITLLNNLGVKIYLGGLPTVVNTPYR